MLQYFVCLRGWHRQLQLISMKRQFHWESWIIIFDILFFFLFSLFAWWWHKRQFLIQLFVVWSKRNSFIEWTVNNSVVMQFFKENHQICVTDSFHMIFISYTLIVIWLYSDAYQYICMCDIIVSFLCFQVFICCSLLNIIYIYLWITSMIIVQLRLNSCQFQFACSYAVSICSMCVCVCVFLLYWNSSWFVSW